MSDLLALPPDDGGADDDDDTSRGRAVWGLVALAILAVLIVVIMIATSGSGGHHGSGGPTGLSSLPSEPGPLPSSTGAPTTSTTTSSSASSTATSALPTSTANPCGAAKSCIVPGDAGQLVAAINRFRTSHGRTAVTGAASPQAQQCSIAQGDGPACAPSYAWEPVGTQDGPKAVERVAARGDGTKWLLDPGMKSFSVGWSYAGGQYACAILKIS